MALSKSDKSGSNVTNLDDARIQRANSSSGLNRTDTSEQDQDDEHQSSQVADDLAEESDKVKKVSNRRFDTVKVERIKAEIARGEYNIDYLHVADKFIEHERYS